VVTLLWVNGTIDPALTEGHAFYHAHPFNVGQHVAHNIMLDECVKLGVDWHIRVDDDCWITTRKWLDKLLGLQEQIKALTGKHAVLGITVNGLNDPPPTVKKFEFQKFGMLEVTEILGGIFRMSPMPLVRYFRWDERQAMGFGDATQFASYCESTKTVMGRMAKVACTHGDSTRKQSVSNPSWSYEHDMLQFIPVGL